MKSIASRFAITSLACALGFGAQAAERWNMSVEQPDGNFITTVAKEFAQDVEKASAGELQIRVHANSVLFKRPEVKRAVQTGQVQLGDVLMSVLGNEDPIFEVDSVPFLVRNYEQAQALWDASRPAVEERLAKQGIKLLYAMPWSPQSIFTKTPIASMDDFKGMKFRAYNPATSRMTELMGAVPTVIQTGEIPQAFSTGMINGMLTSPTTGVDSQAWDFSSYYYDVKAFIPKNFVIVNARASPACRKRPRLPCWLLPSVRKNVAGRLPRRRPVSWSRPWPTMACRYPSRPRRRWRAASSRSARA